MGSQYHVHAACDLSTCSSVTHAHVEGMHHAHAPTGLLGTTACRFGAAGSLWPYGLRAVGAPTFLMLQL